VTVSPRRLSSQLRNTDVKTQQPQPPGTAIHWNRFSLLVRNVQIFRKVVVQQDVWDR